MVCEPGAFGRRVPHLALIQTRALNPHAFWPQTQSLWPDDAARYTGRVRKFPRVVRLDESDVYVFRHAAGPAEWAVVGSFAFADRDPEQLDSKDRLALRSAWLGTESFGFATLVEVAEITDPEFFQVVERLARHFVEVYGAPDLTAALPAARQEADDAASLCAHKVHQLLAVEREAGPGGLVERVHLIHPERAREHAKIWEIVTDDDGPEGDSGAGEKHASPSGAREDE